MRVVLVNIDSIFDRVIQGDKYTIGKCIYDRLQSYYKDVSDLLTLKLAAIDEEDIDLFDYDTGGRYRGKEVLDYINDLGSEQDDLIPQFFENLDFGSSKRQNLG